ncbi:hypothetical protein [Rufibacter psychrotolerans]|uniref:hypothetical protein n=1 Tax=Rufibacter psychrotolerans TaxID=2812556 RepID=UPI001F07BB1B|nr:hypothetical protein [Rufibacter sp. SYSU D00308]
MKKSFLLGLGALVLMGTKCGARPDLPATVYGQTWLYSYEEDSADVRTYRPNTFDFPPSRGRTGFLLQEDGRFTRYGIAPADGLEEQPGKWEASGKDQLRVTFDNPKHKPEVLEIISVSPEKLKIRRKTTQE